MFSCCIYDLDTTTKTVVAGTVEETTGMPTLVSEDAPTGESLPSSMTGALDPEEGRLSVASVHDGLNLSFWR